MMAERDASKHPQWETLAAYAEGGVEPSQATTIEGHLAGCAQCRLEIKQLARFQNIDNDEALCEEADWPRARFALARRFREKITPAIADVDQPPGSAAGASAESTARSTDAHAGERTTEPDADDGRPRGRFALRWLMPIAAAAVVTLVLLNTIPDSEPLFVETTLDVVRGGESVAQTIVLESPVGKVDACPQHFRWSMADSCDSFTLEIFTPDLNVLFHQADIRDTTYAVSDSLRSLLAVDRSYLWSVEGYIGLTLSAGSTSGWFTITP